MMVLLSLAAGSGCGMSISSGDLKNLFFISTRKKQTKRSGLSRISAIIARDERTLSSWNSGRKRWYRSCLGSWMKMETGSSEKRLSSWPESRGKRCLRLQSLLTWHIWTGNTGPKCTALLPSWNRLPLFMIIFIRWCRKNRNWRNWPESAGPIFILQNITPASSRLHLMQKNRTGLTRTW